MHGEHAPHARAGHLRGDALQKLAVGALVAGIAQERGIFAPLGALTHEDGGPAHEGGRFSQERDVVLPAKRSTPSER